MPAKCQRVFLMFLCSPVQDDRDLALQREALMQRHLPGSEDSVGEDPLATSPAQLAIPPAHSASDSAGPVRLELGIDAEMLDKILDELDEVNWPLSVLPLCLKDELLAQCIVELSANEYDTYIVECDTSPVLCPFLTLYAVELQTNLADETVPMYGDFFARSSRSKMALYLSHISATCTTSRDTRN